MISKWGQQNQLNVETSEENMLSNLYDARAYQWEKSGSRWWDNAADVEGNKFGNNTCNILKGSDGTQFPQGVSKENPMWIFNPAFCRFSSSMSQFLPYLCISGPSSLNTRKRLMLEVFPPSNSQFPKVS